MKLRKRKPGERDPEGTRRAILSAAQALLSRDGPEGLSVSQVANIAGINRGTAYQHFSDRESLLNATIESSSQALIDAVWPPRQKANAKAGVPFDDTTVYETAQRLATFTTENASFCRIWLFKLLTSEQPGNDPFGRAWIDVVTAFAKSNDAVPGVDGEAFAIITLMAYLIWPIWMHAEKQGPRRKRQIADRIAKEILRVSMYGEMKADRFPVVHKVLQRDAAKTAPRQKK